MIKKVLVTGGAGYIGSHMVLTLLDAGVLPVVVDDLSTGSIKNIPKSVPFYQMNIADVNQMIAILKNEKIEAVIHFAASIKVEESVSNPTQYYQNNCFSTLNLLNAMLESGVSHIIFSSTASIYGEPKAIPITETHPKKPINPYGTTKLMCEKILADFDVAYGINSVCLRYFNAASADAKARSGFSLNNPSHLIPKILLSIADGQHKFSIYGTDYQTNDGTCVRDFIHVSDLCDAHLLALDYLIAGGASTAFNLGNGVGYSVRQILDTAQKVTRKLLDIHLADRRPGDPSTLIADPAKVKKILKWQAKRDNIETIVADAWEWVKKETSLTMLVP